MDKLRIQASGEKVNAALRAVNWIVNNAAIAYAAKWVAKKAKEHPALAAVVGGVVVLGGTALTIASGGVAAPLMLFAAGAGGGAGGFRAWVKERVRIGEANLRPEVERRVQELRMEREGIRRDAVTAAGHSASGRTQDIFTRYINNSIYARGNAAEHARAEVVKGTTRRILGRTALGGAIGLASVWSIGGIWRTLHHVDWGGVGGKINDGAHDLGEQAGRLYDRVVTGDDSQVVAPPSTDGAIPASPDGTGVMPVSPKVAESAIQDLVNSNPDALRSFLEANGIHVQTVTNDSALAAGYSGRSVFASLQNGAGFNNDQTIQALMDAYTRAHGTAGLDIHTWGDVQFVDGHYQPTGGTWGADMTAHHLQVVDTKGNVYEFDGGLDRAQQTQLDHLLAMKGTRTFDDPVDAATYAMQVKGISPQEAIGRLVDDQADSIADTFGADMAGAPVGTSQAVLQGSLNAYAAANSAVFAQMSDAQLNGLLAQQVAADVQAAFSSMGMNGGAPPSWVNPAVIQHMIDEAIRRLSETDSGFVSSN